MDYGAVLSKTWGITWKNKGLWILGILAGCSASGRGSGGQFSGGFRGFQFDSSNIDRFEFEGVPIEIENFFRGITDEAFLFAIFAMICVFLFLALVFLVLGVIGQGGLIAGFSRADEGADVSLGDAFSLGLQSFWKLLGIRFTVWIIGLIIGIVLVVGVIALGIVTLGLGLICLLPLICLIVPLAFAVDSYITLAMVAAVDEDLSVFEAFGRAWQVFKENLGPMIVMALILVLGGGIVSIILAAPFFAVFVPFIIGLVNGTEQGVLTGLVASGVLFFVALPVVILLSGILSTFVTGAWTLTFRRLTGKLGAETALAES